MTTDANAFAAALSDRYRLERELGQGGMATVWLARDLRHDRDVAIKVLHPELAAVLGAERFLAEIKTTAQLAHPHILPLLDSGSANGLLYYVMPYIAGETLRTRLDRETQLPVADALRIAGEVADALAEAHGRGIVHRDIKPENILLRANHALVADFGISLAVQTAGGARMTQTGLSLGTPQYMSPEQATGEKSVDHRADIYALGAVTYEMLTGEPPFTGANTQVIVAKILTEPVRRVTAVRPAVAAHIDDAIQVALQKLPADRFGTVQEFAEALRGGGEIRHTTTTAVSRRGPQPWALGLVAVLLIGGGVMAGWLVRGSEASGPELPPITVQLDVPTVGGNVVDAIVAGVTIAPDGSRFAYVGPDSNGVAHLQVRSLRDPAAVTAVGATIRASSFSPDGKRIAYVDQRTGKLKLAHIDARSVREFVIREAAATRAIQAGSTWVDDSTLVYADAGGSLHRLDLGTGTSTVIREGGPETNSYGFPAWATRSLVLVAIGSPGQHASSSELELGTVSIVDGRVRRLGITGVRPFYIEGGILTFFRNGQVWGVRVDPETMTPRGTPRLIATVDGRIGRMYAASRNGVLIARRSPGLAGERELVLVDRQGIVRPALSQVMAYMWPRFSPDGGRVSFTTAYGQAFGGDLWITTLADGGLLRLTSDSAALTPEWAHDGRSLLYGTVRGAGGGKAAVLAVPAGGGGSAQTIFQRSNQIVESRLTPDGSAILWLEDDPARGRDLLSAQLQASAAVRPLQATRFAEGHFALSPDGHWYLFTSNETGPQEIYLARLDRDGARWPVSTRGGTEPRWARNGEVFFRNRDSVFVTRITLGLEPRVEPPRALFATPLFGPTWDATPDGQRFVMIRPRGGARDGFELMLNWTDRFREGRAQQTTGSSR